MFYVDQEKTLGFERFPCGSIKMEFHGATKVIKGSDWIQVIARMSAFPKNHESFAIGLHLATAIQDAAQHIPEYMPDGKICDHCGLGAESE